ncbi:MAG: FAD-dependent oxidoreductase [Candidatus Heimdallarchaeota archaeon]|nr:FAD-dependent oxidoreductase [Candidatus Heimdallarchaeota archaeon]
MVEIKVVYGATWCPGCSRLMAYLDEQRVTYKWVNIDADLEALQIVEKINDGKKRVPTVEFTDGTFMVHPTQEEIAKKIGLIKDMGLDFHDLIIIGGGLAGLNCALYAAREGHDIVVIEKSGIGSPDAYIEVLDDYPGFIDAIDGVELAKRFSKQAKAVGVEFLISTGVVDILFRGSHLMVRTTAGRTIGGKAVLIATGRRYRMLHIPGEKELLGYNVHYCATCDGVFYKGKDVIVIGGGVKAHEDAIFLSRFANKVTIVGRSDVWKAPYELRRLVSEKDNIILLKNHEAIDFQLKDVHSLEGVKFYDKILDKEVVLKVEGAFVAIGYIPNVDFATGLFNYNEDGFIETNSNLMTKTPGLFAAGDCRTCCTHQPILAAGDGVASAVIIHEYLLSKKKEKRLKD